MLGALRHRVFFGSGGTLFLSRKQNKNPPVSNPLTTTEIVRKRTQHQQKQQHREAIGSGT